MVTFYSVVAVALSLTWAIHFWQDRRMPTRYLVLSTIAVGLLWPLCVAWVALDWVGEKLDRRRGLVA
jgi:hypothetical protein